MAMKSLANFLSSKKKTKDKAAQQLQQQGKLQQESLHTYSSGSSENDNLHPRSVSRSGGGPSSRTPSPIPSFGSASRKGRFFSSSATQSSGFHTNAKRDRSTMRLQDSPSLPSHPLSRLFFRSAVDVSKVSSNSFQDAPPQQQQPPRQLHASTTNGRRTPSVRVTDTSELGYKRDQPLPPQPPHPSEALPMHMASKGKERAVGNDSPGIADPFASHYHPPSTSTLSSAESPFSPAPVRRPTIGSRSASSTTQQQQQQQRQSIRPRASSLSTAKCPPIPPHVLGPLPPVPKFPPIAMSGPSGQGTTYGPIPHLPSMQITQSAPAEVTSFAASRARSKSVSSGAAAASSRSPREGMAAYRSMSIRQASSTNPLARSEQPSILSNPVPASSSTAKSEAEIRYSGSDTGGTTTPTSRPMSMKVPQLDLTWERFLHEAHEDGKSLPSWTSATMNDLDATTARITGAPDRPLPAPPSQPQQQPVVEPLIVRRRSRAQTLVSGPLTSSSSSTALALYTEVQKLPLPPNARFVNADLATMTPPISPPLSTSAARLFFDFNQIARDVVVVTPPHQLQGEAVAAPQTKAEAGVGIPIPDMKIPGSPDTASSLPYLKSMPVESTSVPETVVMKQQKKSSLSSASMLGWDYSRAGSEMSLSLFPKPPGARASSGMGLGLPQPEKLDSTTMGRPEPSTIPQAAPLEALHELPTPPITPSTFDLPPSMMYTSSGGSQSSTTIRAPSKSAKNDRKSTTPSEAGTLSPSIKSEARSSGSYLSSMDHPDGLTSSSATTVCSQDPDCSTSTFGCGDGIATARSSSETDRSQHTTITPLTAQKARVASGTIWPTAAATSTTTLVMSGGAIPMLAMPSLGSDTFDLLSNLDFGPSLRVLETPVTPAKVRLVRQLSSDLLAMDNGVRTLATNSLHRSPASPYVGGVEWGQAL
ncbi:hypothetical protein FRB97_003017 [Tulasnella sp. 331]|nr:hypothetical protein FRB97_003017 [Tulasnella sp. 331]